MRAWGSCVLVATMVAFAAPSAMAFGLGDHRWVTLQAIQELNACFPGTIGSSQSLVLWASDLEEDLNLFRKDLLYSHFYNPYKQLDIEFLGIHRDDSSERIGDLEDELYADAAEGDRSGFFELVHLGHAIHQLQDMAAPPHVVPVMHGLNDAFEEKFGFDGDISSGWNCDQLASEMPYDLEEVLNETAVQTLKNVADARVEVTADIDGQAWRQVVNGAAFWQDDPGSTTGFGSYGFLGNHYGQARFTQDGVEYTVAPSDFYARFKQEQLRLAVRATLRGLEWQLLPDIRASR